MKTLIKGGTLVTEESARVQDLLLENGRVAQVGENLSDPEAEVIDAAGRLVFPGFIDAHTHMDLPVCGTVTADDFASGTAAAILGGTTCLVDFATQEAGETLAQGLANWHEKADSRSSCDYAFHMAISQWRPDVREELPDMIREGVTSFKVYLTYGNMVSDRELYEVLLALKPLGGIVGVHCENDGIIQATAARLKEQGVTGPEGHPLSRPDEAEAEAIHRLLTVARLVDVPVVVVHLSTEKGLEEIRRARAMGQKVYVETCPQYLFLDDSLYAQPDFRGARYVCSPPLRKKQDQAALWEALAKGEIDTVSTDHCSFTLAQKDAGRGDFSQIPGGMPGVEERVSLMYTYGVETGRLPLTELVRRLSANPAKLYGMYPRKGALLPGSDADVVIWDPDVETVIHRENRHSACDYAPYEGWRIRGRAETVMLRGEKVVEDGELRRPGTGIYIAREASSL
ncbi:MAG: dihydropyrimidinase [Clostridiales bacterium]|nr:dihydropyrimidinase [Clostridiales bacterium]